MKIRKPGQIWQMWEDEKSPSIYVLIKYFSKIENRHQAYWEVLHQGQVYQWREVIMRKDTFFSDIDENETP